MNTNNYHLLQQAVWPTADVGTPNGLYFRATPKSAWRIRSEIGALWLGDLAKAGGALDFSTFFGSFSLTTWCRECMLGEVTLEIACQGAAWITIWHDDGYEPRQLLWSGDVEALPQDDQGHVHVTVSGLQGKSGMLYPVFEPTEAHFQLNALRYMTSQVPRHPVRLALVMPTFKREHYVRRSISLIEPIIRAVPTGAIELIVIDNGQTLGTTAPDGVRIVPNQNYGGAGGFARGVLEVLDDERGFTHVLFCDDDIAVEPQAYARLFNLLHYASEDKIVAGGMLNMQNKGILHEVGARVRGLRFCSVKGGADLTKRQSVIRYDQPEYATFYGWWFTCYPVSKLCQKMLPFPFFVSFDDVEMGLRLGREYQTITLAGIAVWHDEFHKKEMNWRWYYHARNGLAVSYLYDDHCAALKDVFRQIVGALLTFRYERALNLMDGVEDAQKGPNFIRDLKADVFHADKARAQKQVMRPIVADQYVSEKFSPKIKSSRLRRLMIVATLNGHLLPSFMLPPANNAFDPGWAIEKLHSMRLQAIFRKRVVLYYEPTSQQGMLCPINRRAFFSLLFKAARLYLSTRMRASSTRKLWRESWSELVSVSFWKKYLNLKGKVK